MNKVSWTIFTIVTMSILGLLIFVSNSNKISLDVSKVDITAIQEGNEQNGNIADHVYGDAESKVTLIEYGDFQCPGCGEAHTVIKAVIEEYKSQIRFVFRNFPLTTAHANAKAAAAATEAASLQGEYWGMHDKIYESQSDWNSLSGETRTDKFVSYAKSLGLDVNKFKTDFASTAVINKIDYDYALGKKAVVEATPSMYLNGKFLDPNIWSDNAKFKDALNSELKKFGIDKLAN